MFKRYLVGILVFCLVFSLAEIYFFKAFTYLLERNVGLDCRPVGGGNSQRKLFTILHTEPELSFNLLHKEVEVELNGMQEELKMDSLRKAGIQVLRLKGDLYFSNQKNMYILRHAGFVH